MSIQSRAGPGQRHTLLCALEGHPTPIKGHDGAWSATFRVLDSDRWEAQLYEGLPENGRFEAYTYTVHWDHWGTYEPLWVTIHPHATGEVEIVAIGEPEIVSPEELQRRENEAHRQAMDALLDRVSPVRS